MRERGRGASGDYASYTAFVRARQGALLRAAYLLTGDQHRAEDIVQGALVKLAEHWPKVRDGYPEAFVRTVLYRDFVSWWRRHGRERLGPVPDAPSAAIGDSIDAVPDRLLLAAALARLTPRQRAVVVLRFFEDLSTAEAARALNVSVGTVKSQTSVALARLRTELGTLDVLVDEQEER